MATGGGDGAGATPPNSVGYLLRNTNELLGVKNVDGGKTGQTSRAGPCLIVTAAREPLSRSSLWVAPGSRKCTCVSITPGRT